MFYRQIYLKKVLYNVQFLIHNSFPTSAREDLKMSSFKMFSCFLFFKKTLLEEQYDLLSLRPYRK